MARSTIANSAPVPGIVGVNVARLARPMSGPAQRAHPGASASSSNTACGDAADRTVISYDEVVAGVASAC
jgi:hypothetical protein